MKGLALSAIVILIIAITSLGLLLVFFSGPFTESMTDTYCFFNNNIFLPMGINIAGDLCEINLCKGERVVLDSTSKDYFISQIAARTLLCWSQKSPACGSVSICYEMVLKEPLQEGLTEEDFTRYLDEQGACSIIENSLVYNATDLKPYPNCGNNDLIEWEISNYTIKDQGIILIEYNIKENKIVIRSGVGF